VIRRLAAVTALALVGAGLAVGAQADAGISRAQGPAFAADDGPAVSLTLTEYGPAVMKPTDSLQTTAMVSNPTALAVSDLSVTLSVTRSPITSRSALRAFLQDPTSATTQVAASALVVDTPLTQAGGTNVLPAGVSVPVHLSATPRALGMPANTAGVYGVVFEVVSPAGVIATQTAAVTWYAANEIPTLRLAFLATASGSAERTAQLATAAMVSGVALAIDPVTITDDAQARAIAANREIFALPSADVDLTSLAHAENEELIAFSLTDSAQNALDPLAGRPWLATLPVVDDPTVALATSRGAIAGVIDVTAGASIGGVTAPVVDVTSSAGTLPVLVPDAGLSRIAATYHPGLPDASARLVAEAALEAMARDNASPVVVAPGTAWHLTGPGASLPAAELLSAPWVVPVTVQSVINGPIRAEIASSAPRGTSSDVDPRLIERLERRLGDLAQLAVTAEDPNDIYLPGGRALLRPLAVGLRSDPTARDTAFEAAKEEVDATLNGLQVAVGSDVNLIAASGNVPVTLHNDLPVDATVRLVMRSASPNLVVEDQPVVTIPAGGDFTAHVAVTGVKSANVNATLALHNTDGDVVAAPQTLKVRVRADWGNAVTAVFTVGLVLLVVAGVIRTIRRGRRSTRMAPVAPPKKDAPAEHGGDDG